MSEPRDVIDRAARALREPVRMDPATKRRLVAALHEEPRPQPGRVRRSWHWFTRPRQVSISPLSGLAVAGIIALAILVRPFGDGSGTRSEVVDAWGPGAVGAAAHGGERGTLQRGAELTNGVTFTLTAPGASSVSLVGDFNDWDPERHPLRPSAREEGVWEVSVPLEPGRHVYSFFVDGRTWIPDPDPEAARAAGGSFGTPSSVILVAERSS